MPVYFGPITELDGAEFLLYTAGSRLPGIRGKHGQNMGIRDTYPPRL